MMCRPLVLFACLPLPAFAQMAPGEPPWSCTVAAACDAASCIPLPPGLPGVLIEGDRGSHSIAGRPAPDFGSEQAAADAVRAGTIPGDARNLLVRDDHGVSDALGFRLYSPAWRNGVGGLSAEYAALVCT